MKTSVCTRVFCSVQGFNPSSSAPRAQLARDAGDMASALVGLIFWTTGLFVSPSLGPALGASKASGLVLRACVTAAGTDVHRAISQGGGA